MEKLQAVSEEIKNITEKIQGIKITTTYLISTDLYKISADKLTNSFTEETSMPLFNTLAKSLRYFLVNS